MQIQVDVISIGNSAVAYYWRPRRFRRLRRLRRLRLLHAVPTMRLLKRERELDAFVICVRSAGTPVAAAIGKCL